MIREIHREAKREHEALVRLRESTERHAEQAAAEAERAYHQADASHTLVRQRLASQWEDALRRVEELRTEHRLHPLTSPLTLTDPEQAELRQLLTELPALWRHPRVTPEQRKAVVRAVIATIHLRPGPAAWELEIEWVGGERTRFEFLTSKGVQDVVEQAVKEGRTATEIAGVLSERGAIQRSGPHIGQPYTATSVKVLIRRLGWERSFKRDAYTYLRARYLEGIPLRQIAKELDAQGIRHPHGEWTEHRVQGAIHRLRMQTVADVAQLSGIQRLADRVITLHDTGLSAGEIATKLRGEGALTMRRRSVSPDTVRQILRRRGMRPRGERTPKRQRWAQATDATLGTVDLPDALTDRLQAVGRLEPPESAAPRDQDLIVRRET